MTNIEKTVKNSIYSIIARVIILVLGFVNRKLFIVNLNLELLAYTSLFSNIFSILSLAELGVGNIISFHLYREVQNNNTNEIGKLMYIYKWFYRLVAIFVLICGCILVPFLKYLIKDNSYDFNLIYIVYFLTLFATVSGYFLSYRRTIFIVTQQEYRCEKADLLASLVTYVIRFIILITCKNFILYLVVAIFTGIISNLIIFVSSNKNYPYLNDRYQVNKEYLSNKNMFKDIFHFFITRIATTVYGATDNIIISAFLGIKYVALYSNYILISSQVNSILVFRMLNPLQATLGNILYSNRTKEELWDQFEMLDILSYYLATYMCLGYFIFYQPFITLWLGSEYLISNYFVLLYCMTIYFIILWEIICKYRSCFGNYEKDTKLMIASAILNVVISIAASKYMGLAGIQLGTLVGWFMIGISRVRQVVGFYFNKNIVVYILKHILLSTTAFGQCIASFFILRHVEISPVGVILRIFVWLLFPLCVNTIVSANNPYFDSFKSYINKTLLAFINLVKVKVRGR